MYSLLHSFNIWISRLILSNSEFIGTIFTATISFVGLCIALYTEPYDPSPNLFLIFYSLFYFYLIIHANQIHLLGCLNEILCQPNSDPFFKLE